MMVTKMMQVYVILIVEVDTKELDQFVGKIALQDFQIQELIVWNLHLMVEELVTPVRVNVFHIFLLRVVKNGVYYGIQNAERTFTM
jgi:hypothetical protein